MYFSHSWERGGRLEVVHSGWGGGRGALILDCFMPSVHIPHERDLPVPQEGGRGGWLGRLRFFFLNSPLFIFFELV